MSSTQYHREVRSPVITLRTSPVHSSKLHHFSQAIKESHSSIDHAHRITDLLGRDTLCFFFSTVRSILLNSKRNPKHPWGSSPVHLLLDQLELKENPIKPIKPDRLQHTTQVGTTLESNFSWLFSEMTKHLTKHRKENNRFHNTVS